MYIFFRSATSAMRDIAPEPPAIIRFFSRPWQTQAGS